MSDTRIPRIVPRAGAAVVLALLVAACSGEPDRSDTRNAGGSSADDEAEAPHREDAPEQPEPDFATPCPEPEGGWAVVDEATATRAARDAVADQAQRREDFAGLWIDNSDAPYDDPTKIVLNVRVTGDVTAAEADLREVWGGALCVSSAEHTHAELRAIQNEISDDLIGTSLFISSGVDETQGLVHVEVSVDNGLQAEVNDRYGAGLVKVTVTSNRPVTDCCRAVATTRATTGVPLGGRAH